MFNKILSKSLATSAVIVATTSLIAVSASESKAVVVGFNQAIGAVGPNLAYAAGTFTKAGGATDDSATITPTTLTLTGYTQGGSGFNAISTLYTFDVTGLVGATAPENQFSFDYDLSDPDQAIVAAGYSIDGAAPVNILGNPNPIGPIALNGLSTSSIAFVLTSRAASTTNAPVFTITNFSAPGIPVVGPPTTTPEPSAVLGLLFLLGAGSLSRFKA